MTDTHQDLIDGCVKYLGAESRNECSVCPSVSWCTQLLRVFDQNDTARPRIPVLDLHEHRQQLSKCQAGIEQYKGRLRLRDQG